MNIVSVSENTVVILFDQIINHENFLVITELVNVIEKNMSDSVVDIIPSYASVHVTFNLLKVSGLDFRRQLKMLIKNHNFSVNSSKSEKIIEIPVYYGKEVALDLSYIADRAKLSEDEVVEAHSSKVYDVYAIGFAPGFAYLGNVDERISSPRKETPRKKVLKGSLGIADQQTAIYPSDSPGGWQIIGRTPVQLIDYNSEKLTQFSAGDKVKFTPISKSEYASLGGDL
ncbi:MAG: 5-oxoprolinase subunit PxpB [Cellvibrionaceae bacterium]